MKKITVFASIFVIATQMCMAQTNFAVVDIEELLKIHPNTANDRKQLELTLSDYSKERDALRANLEKIDSQIGDKAKEASNPMLAPEMKIQLRDEAMKLQEQLQAESRSAEMQMAKRQRDLEELERRLVRRTSDEILAHVKAYATANKIDLVVYKNGTAFFEPKLDITPEIVKAIGVLPAKKTDDESATETKKEQK